MRCLLLLDGWRITAMGAPPQLPVKELGDPSAPPHSFLRMLGSLLLRIHRLETPLRRFTSTDHETVPERSNSRFI
jgi:hypothetical protein